MPRTKQRSRVSGSNRDPFKHAEVIKVGTPNLPGPDTVQPGKGKVVVDVIVNPAALDEVRRAAAAKRVLRGTGSPMRPAPLTSQIPKKTRR